MPARALGFFTHGAGVGLASVALLAACADLTESVSTDVCLSGIRWVGGNSRDEEMSPGTDCLGCHLEYDGPPLSAAGTVYATSDNASQIENDCFGLEGVEVEIEAANGTVLRTKTNRAGNFWFDGTPATLAKPYIARFRYTMPDGAVVTPQMVVTEAYYGGCAQCHDPRASATPELLPTDPGFTAPAPGLFVQ